MTIGTRIPLPLAWHGTESPCVKHACRLCCFETEMPLLPEDVARLQQRTGLEPTEFSEPDPDLDARRLINRDGACVFLGDAGCTVYEDRPAGCRIYPLVFDADTNRPMTDPLCPYRQGFDVKPSDREALMQLVDRLSSDDTVAPARHPPMDEAARD